MSSSRYKNLGSIISYIMGIAGFVLTVLTFQEAIAVPLCIIIYLCTGLFILMIILIFMLKSEKGQVVKSVNSRISIIQVVRDTLKRNCVTGENDVTDYFLLNSEDQLRYDSIVTVYYVGSGKSKRIATGIVVNPKDDDCTQIEIIKIENDLKDIYERAVNNDTAILRQMYIMPTVYKEDISWMVEKRENTLLDFI